MPPTPMLSNGAAHPSTISPTVALNVAPNGAPPAPPTVVQKLAVANEQTWLLIGMWGCFVRSPVRIFILI